MELSPRNPEFKLSEIKLKDEKGEERPLFEALLEDPKARNNSAIVVQNATARIIRIHNLKPKEVERCADKTWREAREILLAAEDSIKAGAGSHENPAY